MFSLVICSRDSQKFARVSEMYRRLLGPELLEIIHIPDATGLAEGYNRAIAKSRGEALIFSHDDVRIFAEDFRQKLLGHLSHCDLLGIAGTDRLCGGRWIASGPPHVFGQIVHPHKPTSGYSLSVFGAPKRRIDGIQALDGVFLCCRRDVAEKIVFDSQTFTGFHVYDVDFSFRAYLAGCRLAVCNDLDLLHESAGAFGNEFVEFDRRFCEKHKGKLAPLFNRQFQLTGVVTPVWEEVLEVMRPGYWKE